VHNTNRGFYLLPTTVRVYGCITAKTITAREVTRNVCVWTRRWCAAYVITVLFVSLTDQDARARFTPTARPPRTGRVVGARGLSVNTIRRLVYINNVTSVVYDALHSPRAVEMVNRDRCIFSRV
jgi:predicted RNA-binding protein YlqC (UPF0109 family)